MQPENDPPTSADCARAWIINVSRWRQWRMNAWWTDRADGPRATTATALLFVFNFHSFLKKTKEKRKKNSRQWSKRKKRKRDRRWDIYKRITSESGRGVDKPERGRGEYTKKKGWNKAWRWVDRLDSLSRVCDRGAGKGNKVYKIGYWERKEQNKQEGNI